MGVGLFGFIFKTIRRRANDPANAHYWLPKRLLDLEAPDGAGKLLPLHATNWDIGEIGGASGSNVVALMKGPWWLTATGPKRAQYAQQQAIACPDAPWPRLGIPQATIHGLENAWVVDDPTIEEPGFGYRASVVIEFGHYDPADNPSVSALQFTGIWTLDQCFCSAPKSDPTRCDGALHETIHGEGPISVTIGGPQADSTISRTCADATIDVQIAGSGADRSIEVVVRSLRLRGATVGSYPVLKVTELDFTTPKQAYKGIWRGAAVDAIEKLDGTASIIGHLNDALNRPDHLAQMSRMFTANLLTIIDDTLGAVPPGQLPSGQEAPNPVDLYLFDRLRYALNDPASQVFVPRVILGVNDPKLEPDVIDAIDLGSQSVAGILTFDNIELKQVTIAGFSNATIPATQLVFHQDQGSVDAVLVLSALPQQTVAVDGRNLTVPAPPLTLSGKLDFSIEGDTTVYPGTVAVSVNGSQISTTLQFTGPDADSLTITFQNIHLTPDPGAITVKLDVDSHVLDFINQVANMSTIQQKVIDAVNDRAAGHLHKLGAAATETVRAVIARKLDG